MAPNASSLSRDDSEQNLVRRAHKYKCIFCLITYFNQKSVILGIISAMNTAISGFTPSSLHTVTCALPTDKDSKKLSVPISVTIVEREGWSYQSYPYYLNELNTFKMSKKIANISDCKPYSFWVSSCADRNQAAASVSSALRPCSWVVAAALQVVVVSFS